MATKTRRRSRATTSSRAAPDHDRRWRPRSGSRRLCRFTFRGKVCRKKGSHYCAPRADKVVAFFDELLCHTKGQWTRQRFTLADWQEHDIIRPLFGEIVWSKQWGCYIRRYRIAWIELGRKNGKSELAAGIALYMLVGDDEEAAEVYGGAKDKDQAKKVWEPAERMKALSPILASRLGVNRQEKRIFDEKTASYYRIITADDLGELGHNPHAVILDEIISQPSADLWNAMRTAMGARTQALMVALTTAGDDPAAFAAVQHDEYVKVAKSPRRAPHIFAYIRNTPKDADPWDEENWYYANPALGSFLSIEALRDEALEARNEPQKENAFRQYRLNQWVQQKTRWMPLHLWGECGKATLDKMERDLAGQPCFGGLDLASTTDLAAICWYFPGKPNRVLWRFFMPEAQVDYLDGHTGNSVSKWIRDGLITVTPGDWIDYDTIWQTLDADLTMFDVVGFGYDPWGATDIVQKLQKAGINAQPVRQTYEGLSNAMGEIMRMVKSHDIEHAGNPVARWNMDGVEVQSPAGQPDVIKPVKPKRNAGGKRIDGTVAFVVAIAIAMLNVVKPRPGVVGAADTEAIDAEVAAIEEAEASALAALEDR